MAGGRHQKRRGTAGLEIYKGAPLGEPCLAGFGGVVFQGEAKAAESWRQGNVFGSLMGFMERRAESSEPERNKPMMEPLRGSASQRVFEASSERGIENPLACTTGFESADSKGNLLWRTGLGRWEPQQI